MDSLLKQLNAAELLDQLCRDELVAQADQENIRQFILSRHERAEPPLSLRIMVGIGAFLASVSFIGFLMLLRVIDFNAPIRMLLTGIVFIVLALILGHSANRHELKLKGDFFLLSSFCVMGVGKFMVLASAAHYFPDHRQLAMAIAGLVMTVLTYNIYGMSIDRFISSCATMLFFWLGISHVGSPHLRDFIMMDGYFILMAFITGFVFMNSRLRQSLMPVGYASAVMTCVISLFISIAKGGILFLPEASAYALSSSIISLVLVVSIIWLIGWAAGGWRRWQRQHLLVAILGAMASGIVAAHGVLVAICLMILAYARHERLLAVMGMIYAPVYLISYYYNLDISLMQKSLILMLSGAILLAGWGYMAWQKLDRGSI